MPVIYVDNYRGFQDTYIPLKKINFLVGENSTGKTSLLKLIRILTDFRFWFNLDFNTEDIQLGCFSEIASYSNPNKREFTIGLLGDDYEKTNPISAVKMKFIPKEGFPVLTEVNFIEQGLNVHAKISETTLKYRHNTVSTDQINESNKLRYFKLWIHNSGLRNKTFKDIQVKDTPLNQTYYYIQLIIFNDLKISPPSIGYRMPLFMRDIAWLAPIRTEPKRTYDRYVTSFNPDGTHAPYVLKNLLTNPKNKALSKKVETILSKFGTDSGLFDKITINPLGKSETAPFEVLISLEGNPIKITSVGYGVSQILPLIVEVISRPNDTWFAIQQPEIHLHPKGQAAFGDFIYKSHLVENKCFIIETHSDFIIDRFRIRISNSKKDSKYIDSQVIFFNRKEGINYLSCIQINEDGSYCEDQPKEFRDFFIKEQLNLLKI